MCESSGTLDHAVGADRQSLERKPFHAPRNEPPYQPSQCQHRNECDDVHGLDAGRIRAGITDRPGSVLRHGGIDVRAPASDATGKVGDSLESLRAEKPNGGCTADPVMTVNHDLPG